VGKQKYRSSVKHKTNFPTWDERFVFKLPKLCASLQHSPLKVTVIDNASHLTSGTIGAVEFNQVCM
jgi:hypothetical protein